ncbi:MFS transporter [Fictibacillus sp. WQ 8-8]|uniref:MFS transporter n=1 Tax=Fictibacillus sp. WQ 8-8 TaxID=2938788 RepID=UPI0021099CA5|nr:MFS transporter [Fictibacillus sp. WQ 8-8]MCQ6266766.1 MFS transporter [Fictibacillus sp. WQ 8-8]
MEKKYSIMTLILLWSGLVIVSSMYVTIPLTTVFTGTFHKTANQAAWIGSAFSLCYAIGCLLYGPFSDMYGRKIFLASSISALAIVSFIIGFIDHFSGLVMLRALEGLIAAAFAPISFVYAAEMFPPEKRLTAVGFILMVSFINFS